MGCAASATASQVVENVHYASKFQDDQVPRHFVARMHKGSGDLVGASLGSTPSGAVIVRIQEGGILDKWNKSNPDQVMCPGFIIEEVNGERGYWNVLEEMRGQGPMVCQIATVPPPSAGPEWFEDINKMAKQIEESSNRAPFMLKVQPQDQHSGELRKEQYSTLPSLKAEQCGVDHCAICCEDVQPHERLVQLPCGHAYHPLCAARWLTQNPVRPGGRRQKCPICCRCMVSTPDGKVVCAPPNSSCC